MKITQEYIDLLPTALLRIQWLEESLKQYLLRAHVVIACRTQDILRYKLSEDVIWQMPLGKLAHGFDGLCPNQALAARVKNIVKKRNSLAHAGYVIAHEEQADDQAMGVRLVELKEVSAEIGELLKEVMAEVSKVQNAMPEVFDGITKSNHPPEPTPCPVRPDDERP